MLQTKRNVHTCCLPCSPHRQDKVREQLFGISWEWGGDTGRQLKMSTHALWREQVSVSEELRQSITSTSASLGKFLVWSYSDSLSSWAKSVSSPLDEKGDFTSFAVFNQMEKHPCCFPPGTYCKKNVRYVECNKVKLITYLMTVIMRIKQSFSINWL